ncbi:MAG: [Fe-Fe] hydrogenase large subunit C-terminal domain-containing protein [Clostridia bacterium]|nr:[Fe-Fe] hydrogenase large subunit C-terminal domain-containing protein [Clostridia bacterium]
MSNVYHHSVTLDKTKCVGCTNCLKKCPTEAIRVHGGRAHIIDERCIDCGECIRACAYHAKVALTDTLDSINRFEYKIALPAPALYGQFKHLANVENVAGALISIGFDWVYDVARGADIVSRAVQDRLKNPNCPKPLISSSCPAVVRLIQTRFPELIDNIVEVKSPMEMAAIQAKREFCQTRGVSPEQVGCFFITPCAAKVTAIKKPIGHEKSAVDGAVSILDIYGLLNTAIRKNPIFGDKTGFRATALGVGWARTGGEALAAGIENALAVDGIESVAKVLEEIENNRLSGLTFFEGLACVGGCVGGALVFENVFIARNRIRELLFRLPKLRPEENISDEEMRSLAHEVHLDKPILPINAMQIDSDLQTALKKANQVEEIRQRLPGLDCGSCGSPSCRSLAEDIVGGFAHEMDCIFVLKARVRDMAKQMVELSDNTRI